MSDDWGDEETPSVLDLLTTFGELMRAFEERGWSKEQIGWFLLGAATGAAAEGRVDKSRFLKGAEDSFDRTVPDAARRLN